MAIAISVLRGTTSPSTANILDFHSTSDGSLGSLGEWIFKTSTSQQGILVVEFVWPLTITEGGRSTENSPECFGVVCRPNRPAKSRQTFPAEFLQKAGQTHQELPCGGQEGRENTTRLLAGVQHTVRGYVLDRLFEGYESRKRSTTDRGRRVS